MRSCFAIICAGIAACAVVLGSSSTARAESVIGADFKLAVPVGDEGVSSLAIGFDARYGYRIGLGPVYLQPEAQIGYESFPLPSLNLPAGVTADFPTHLSILTLVGGARFGLAGPIQPNVFVHAGYGGVTQTNGASGLVIDAGGAIDFKLIPLVSFGAELGFTDFIGSQGGQSQAFKFVHFGPEAALHF